MNRANPGQQSLALLAFAVQRIARAVRDLPGVDAELLQIADADAMLVLDDAGVTLTPELKAIADARRAERTRMR